MSAIIADLDPITDREAWLAERRRYLGATDVAAIVGLSPYSSPLTVWLEKTGRAEPQPMSAVMLRGLRLEPYIAQLYSEEQGEPVVRAEPVQHPQCSYLRATPDYRVAGPDDPIPYYVECKSHSPRVAHEYGPEGTDEAPDREVVQVQWQMHVALERERPYGGDPVTADLAVLFGVDDFRVYSIRYDGELASALEESARRFWRNHIDADIAPEPAGMAAEADAIARAWPRDTGATVVASPVVEEAIQQLQEARVAVAEASARREALEAIIKSAMGDASYLESSQGRFSWKARKGSTSWKAVAEELGAPADVIARHTPETGGRVFLTPWK